MTDLYKIVNNLLRLWPIFAFAFFLIFLYYLPSKPLIAFLSSSYLSSVVTIFVGISAYVIYSIQKRDDKRAKAQIIYQEIESAVSSMKDIRKSYDPVTKSLLNLPYESKVLRTSSWDMYKHLYVSDFNPKEFESISEFYNLSGLADEAIKNNNSYIEKNYDQYRSNIIKMSSDQVLNDYNSYSKETNEITRKKYIGELQKKIFDITAFYLGTVSGYNPKDPVVRVDEYISEINLNILLSSAGVKLRKLANLSE